MIPIWIIILYILWHIRPFCISCIAIRFDFRIELRFCSVDIDVLQPHNIWNFCKSILNLRFRSIAMVQSRKKVLNLLTFIKLQQLIKLHLSWTECVPGLHQTNANPYFLFHLFFFQFFNWKSKLFLRNVSHEFKKKFWKLFKKSGFFKKKWIFFNEEHIYSGFNSWILRKQIISTPRLRVLMNQPDGIHRKTVYFVHIFSYKIHRACYDVFSLFTTSVPGSENCSKCLVHNLKYSIQVNVYKLNRDSACDFWQNRISKISKNSYVCISN